MYMHMHVFTSIYDSSEVICLISAAAALAVAAVVAPVVAPVAVAPVAVALAVAAVRA